MIKNIKIRLKEKVLISSVFKYTCEHYGIKIFGKYDTFYFDDKKKISVFLVNRDSEENKMIIGTIQKEVFLNNYIKKSVNII